ncbi:MAG TPA: imidazole glycerol phosphate synthase subunit HisH [Vicinamibacterales bacterium]|nr:imidazole glycerol phosphate synthase subunit HisH [Vicinamibacterales bacterium]
MIALVDYQAGNLTSVKKALASLGADVFVPVTPADLAKAQAVIVPGVGHFGATRALQGAWTDAILERVGEGRPLLGICLGMQWLFEGSEEADDVPGLGVLPGRCVKLRSRDVKIPHVGWNDLLFDRTAGILEGVTPGSQVYFTHSYVAPASNEMTAETDHGERFVSVVQRGYIAGVQFHPEKSGDVGLRILRNFVEMAA